MTSVVKSDAPSRNDDARAETVIITLNEGHHVSVTVSRAQVNGTAGVYIDGFWHPCLISNGPSTPFGIGFGQPIRNRRLHESRIGNCTFSRRQSQLHGFNLAMNRFDIVPLFIKRKALYNIERHEDD